MMPRVKKIILAENRAGAGGPHRSAKRDLHNAGATGLADGTVIAATAG
jgi:hypothetical protein